MNKSILFIQESTSFLLNAIKASLINNAFECRTVSFDTNEISRVLPAYEYVFINLEKDTVFKNRQTLLYLKEKVGHNIKCSFMVMGTPNDISDFIQTVGENYIAEIFERPINTQSVTDRIISAYTYSPDSCNQRKILVVDDSGTYLHTIRDWLKPYYKVIIVNSATSAISYLANNEPDLILLDYEMPVCSGPKLLEMIRSDPNSCSIPVMFLTGKGDRESVQKVLALRPQGYLLKSLPKDNILDSLRIFFEGQE